MVADRILFVGRLSIGMTELEHGASDNDSAFRCCRGTSKTCFRGQRRHLTRSRVTLVELALAGRLGGAISGCLNVRQVSGAGNKRRNGCYVGESRWITEPWNRSYRPSASRTYGPNPAVSGRLAAGYFLLGQTLVTFPQCQSQAPMELLHRRPVVSSDLDPLSARYLDTLGVDPTIPL